MSHTISHFYRFGEFALDADQRVLLKGDRPVPLRPKVFDTLLVLVERSGRIVGKEELMTQIWPDSFVEEDNLTFNIRQLRKALGDDARWPRYVETVSRRGYRFIADVEEVLADSQTERRRLRIEPAALPRDYPCEVEPVVPAAAQLPPNNKRYVTVAALIGILLLGSVVLIRGFRQNRNAGATAEAVMPPDVPPFKVEKLTATGTNRHAVISPDGQYVAYTNEVKGRVSIWLRQLNTGSTREVISFSEGYIYGMAYAHDSEHLYFVKGHPEPTAMYAVPMPLGGVPVKLATSLEGSFSVAPDDSQVAFIRYSDSDDECALVIANSTGGNERTLVVHSQPDRLNTPAWSPDGQVIAAAAGPSDSGLRQVRIVELSVVDGVEKELSADRWFHVSRLVWLPDKTGLIVVGEKTPGGRKEIWKVSYPGGESIRISDGPNDYVDVSVSGDFQTAVAIQMTFTSNLWIGPAGEEKTLKRVAHAVGGFCWTPDGRIIYSASAAADRNLWAMKADGSDQQQLTNTGQNINPAVSPDGRFIVFVSNREGPFQVWRMNSDGSDQIPLTKGIGGNEPTVSPDGRWVIFHGDDGRLWRVSIDGGTPDRVSDSLAESPSVSPDGRLIATIGKIDKKERRLFVLPFEGGAPLSNFDFATQSLSSYRLQWEPNGQAVFYAVLTDGVTCVYKQRATGGAPQKMFDVSGDDLFDFSYSPDGQQFAATRGGWQFDLVLLNGFKPYASKS